MSDIDPDEVVWTDHVIRLGAVPGTWEELEVDPTDRASIMGWLGEVFDTQHMAPDVRIEWHPRREPGKVVDP